MNFAKFFRAKAVISLVMLSFFYTLFLAPTSIHGVREFWRESIQSNGTKIISNSNTNNISSNNNNINNNINNKNKSDEAIMKRLNKRSIDLKNAKRRRSSHYNNHNSTGKHQQQTLCVISNHLTTDDNFHSFIANITSDTGDNKNKMAGHLNFEFIFPAKLCCPNVLFFQHDQLSMINDRLTCWEKENLVKQEEDKLLRLTPKFSWSGCHMVNISNVEHFVCKGGRSIGSNFMSVELYSSEDLVKLQRSNSCWEKGSILKSHQVDDQIIEMSSRMSGNRRNE
ncbi:hypothetical protein HELRODRAFT_176588 [Helobdella robusta]|uniref:GPR180-like N-terminal domain-containing protein n=1 Tax=Helobdella robusta TaxID=6412 RepID=T1FAP3_HELRO|nr:hypothetical protein HELRODRAFT_176588 [Helobdella robusta]ESN99822.1 hypothetical protein HELRODRAFT_176588 [Helobdella robusta]